MRAIKISKTRLKLMKDSILLSDFIRYTCPDLPNDGRRNKYCICPFHKERTGSLVVNDDLNKFYCFGCGAKGDHIHFIYHQHFAHRRFNRLNWDESDDIMGVDKSTNTRQVHKVFIQCVRKLSQITGVSIK